MGKTLGIYNCQHRGDGLNENTKMKVLILMTDSYAGFGGIAQYNRDTLDSLNTCDKVSEMRSITRLPKNIDVELPEKLNESTVPNKLSYLVKVLNEVILWRPDVILCGHINLLSIATIAGLLGRFPVILEIYGIDAWYDKGWLTRLFLKRVNRVIAISKYTQKRFLSWSSMDESAMDVIPNAIHFNRYLMTEKPDHLVSRYSLEGKRILLTLGRLSSQEKYKGHDRIISLMPKLLDHYPDLIYLIAGDGDDRVRLEKMTSKLKIKDFVRFVGRVAENEIIDHYNVADAFAMPSTGEGFGFVFLEAAACGLPVLGGGVDGSADALLDGELGIMIDPANETELFEGLIQLLEKPVRAVQREKLNKFSFDRFKGQVIDSLNMVTEHGG